jgi:NAD+ synthase
MYNNNINAEKVIEDITEWIKKYFEENGTPDTKAVLGISGGKDSSIAAALCVKALGKDRVIGVLMPQGEQADIDCSRKLVEFLGIENYTINIGSTVNALLDEISADMTLTRQAEINTPARIRMTTVYAVAACMNGRVVNTCNLSEDWIGYSTKFGDSAGDFSPLSDLTVTEVVKIGDALGLPYELVHKVPIDGLSGKTDEENFGFTYNQLDTYLLKGSSGDPAVDKKIAKMHEAALHKLTMPATMEFDN